MYKRDRALKQQKKALIRSNGFKLESVAPPPASPLQTDYSFTGTLHSLPTISKSLLPSTPSSITPTDYEANLYGPPSLGMAMQSHVPLTTQYQYTAFPGRAIKAECPDYTSSPESLTGYPYPDMYPSASPQPPSLPPLVLELLRCDPDELVVQNKIVTHLQQEQSGRGRLDKPSTFSLMCRMADQTLFSIVEWARSCIFFKELRVSPESFLLSSCSRRQTHAYSKWWRIKSRFTAALTHNFFCAKLQSLQLSIPQSSRTALICLPSNNLVLYRLYTTHTLTNYILWKGNPILWNFWGLTIQFYFCQIRMNLLNSPA